MKLPIPAPVLAQHVAVLGKTGSGKTSTGKLIIEQVVAAGARVCILDTIKSDWWGLTSSADGKKPGLPFHILGGPHGHVPLHAGAGKAVAEVVASGALPLSIIDMADFKAGGVAGFFVDFAEVLLRKMKGVLYLVIEEAHEVAPKERAGFGAENMAIHWAKKLATAGRSKGIRLIVLTQRTQSLHNALLGSCDTVIAHRFTAPADQRPIVDWLKANCPADVAAEVAASLSSLKTGEGWLCAGEARIFERRQFPRIKTYDNTATPTGDGEDVTVQTAAVDTEKLRAIIGAAVKEAEDNDPKALRAQIASLTRQLQAKAPAAPVAPAGASKAELAAEYTRGREDGFDAGHAAALKAVGDIDALLAKAEAVGIHNGRIELAKELAVKAKELEALGIKDLAKAIEHLARSLEKIAGMEIRARPAAPTVIGRPVTRPQVAVAALQPKARPVAPAAAPRANGATHAGISKTGQNIIDALAWLESVKITEAPRAQIAAVADRSPTSGAYGSDLARLEKDALIAFPRAGYVALTDAGRAVANYPDVPPTTAALHDTLSRKLGGSLWNILKSVIDVYPEALSRDELAQRANRSATSGAFSSDIAQLEQYGLISYPTRGVVQARPILFLEGR